MAVAKHVQIPRSTASCAQLCTKTFRTIVYATAASLISLKISWVGGNGNEMGIRLLVAAIMSPSGGYALCGNEWCLPKSALCHFS